MFKLIKFEGLIGHASGLLVTYSSSVFKRSSFLCLACGWFSSSIHIVIIVVVCKYNIIAVLLHSYIEYHEFCTYLHSW